ncbi:DUF7556 family protein [Halorubrum amylolyticum]
MYIPQGNSDDTGPERSVMGAVDNDRYVIADLEHESRWITIAEPLAVDLHEFR